MQSKSFLFSHRWTLPSLIASLLFGALFITNNFCNVEFGFLQVNKNSNLTDEIALSGLIISMLLLAFCKEKIEDEYYSKLRLRCWQLALVVNYGLLLVGIWTSYGLSFLVLTYFNLLTPLVIYLVLYYGRKWLDVLRYKNVEA